MDFPNSFFFYLHQITLNLGLGATLSVIKYLWISSSMNKCGNESNLLLIPVQWNYVINLVTKGTQKSGGINGPAVLKGLIK